MLERLGVYPSDVTDVVLTHLHWDHAGAMEPYSDAIFWVQRAEFEWASSMVDEDTPVSAGIKLEELQLINEIESDGRLVLLDGDQQHSAGFNFHRGGGHTPGIQWLEIPSVGDSGTVVLASDNAFLFENIDRPAPIGACSDQQENLDEIKKMINVAEEVRLVVPGHDPLTMDTYEPIDGSIVEIK
jgi:glyoxylase-like metal-dependent hydrolase (beta-lactamase superfamily II)